MTISALQLTKKIYQDCNLNLNQLKNTKLHKIIYLLHMAHLGQKGKPLVQGRFEARQVGPIHIDLFNKMQGQDAQVFSLILENVDDIKDKTILKFLEGQIVSFKKTPENKLFSIIAGQHTAFLKIYQNQNIQDKTISDKMMLSEYNSRMQKG